MTTPNPGAMTPQQFIDKWRNTRFGEKQASQTWFNDLLQLVGHPDPIEYGDRENFTFEKAVPGGFADAYKQGHFGWEFKRSHRQLQGAFDQLLRYQVYLQTPPLLVVSAFSLIRIQTNFPGKETVVHDIPITELTYPEQFNKLRNIFFAPQEFDPGRTVEEVTQETARLFAKIAKYMECEDIDAERMARYLNQLALCLYAENTDLLPESVFTRITKRYSDDSTRFNMVVRNLFAKMSEGGLFGIEDIPYFNGDLFDGAEPVELNEGALLQLSHATDENWRNIEPSIFGTLFERALDATKRSSYGTHYTSADDIMLVIEPVLMKPLRREWDAAKSNSDALLADGETAAAFSALNAFRERLTNVTVLDPACGSGNFLYIALRSLLDLEREVIDYTERRHMDYPEGKYAADYTPRVSPSQMYGLELDPYAAELARTALWIGYIQWHDANGIAYNRRPVMTPLDTIRRADAILEHDHDDNPIEPEWPAAEFIVGNPPFLGQMHLRREIGDKYIEELFRLYGDRIPNSSDICCYWFEKARAQIESGKAKRAGLLATQAIRFQTNRPVLARIKESGDIFMAVSDQNWVLEGANVHISIVGFDDGSDTERTLDGASVSHINADLSVGNDLTQAQRLAENANISFKGDVKTGPFDISRDVAERMLTAPNPHGRPNSDVVKRWMNGRDLNQTPRDMWIIDFGVDMPEAEAALYEAPFEYVASHVKPVRDKNRDNRLRQIWWLHGAAAPKMRQAIEGLERYIATSNVSKHRIFAFIDGDVLPDATLIVFARDDDYTFGVLSSRIHTTWALSIGTQLEARPRYTPTTCFQTFPFPYPTDEQRAAIAAAAKRLDELRRNWLHPSATDIPGDDADVEAELRRRTLTALYNANPTWLQHAHAALDAAVAAAYGWDADLGEQEILARLLELNLQRYEEEQAG